MSQRAIATATKPLPWERPRATRRRGGAGVDVSRRAAIAVMAVALAGCGKGTSIGAAPAGASAGGDEDTLSAKQILQKGGLCSDDRVVDNPPADSPESVIYKMYEAALGPDDEETFGRFRALFPEQRNTRELRENYWTKVRKNAHKYLVEPGKPAFAICRTMPVDNGMKFFIKTNDPRQHPPPITVGDADGTKKILALTPF